MLREVSLILFSLSSVLFFVLCQLGSQASAQVRLLETGGGSEYVGWQAPAAISTNVMWTLPSADGSANQCLATNGSGALNWSSAAVGWPLTAPAGASAALPSFTFLGSTNTGIFSPAANSASVTTAGFERIRVQSSGNVGIGTTTPLRLLHVGGPIRINAATAPSSPAAGDLFIDSSTGNVLKYHNGTTWISMGAGGGDFLANGTVPMTGALRLADANGLVFTSDTDTGLYSGGDGVVNFATNGLDMMSVGDAGAGPRVEVYGSFSVVDGAAVVTGNNSTPYLPFSSTLNVPYDIYTEPNQPALTIKVNNIALDDAIVMDLSIVQNSSSVLQFGYWGTVTKPTGFSPAIVFGQSTGATSYSERLRIDGNGNVGVGNSAPTYKLQVNGDISIASTNALRFGATSVCTSAGCTAVSDESLKENIKPLRNSLEKVLSLQGVEYDFKDRLKYPPQRQVGLIAQALEQIYPEVVYKDSLTGIRTVAYDHLVGPLVEAIKALNDRIDQIEKGNRSMYAPMLVASPSNLTFEAIEVSKLKKVVATQELELITLKSRLLTLESKVE